MAMGSLRRLCFRLCTTTLSLFLAAGCGLPELPPALSDADAKVLSGGQGIAGRAVIHEGNCMPNSPPFSGCRNTNLPMILHVLHANRGDPTLVPGRTECTPKSTKWVSSVAQLLGLDFGSLDSDKTVDLQHVTEFGIPLPVGDYFIVLTDRTGCGWCNGGWSQWSPDRSCSPVHVSDAQVTGFDLRYEYAAY